ncbi:MAG: hypothetical protein IJF92_03370 [Bacilli bacterium]|nr:hypothetical protein [Bacilli bacterium]
MNNQLFLFWKIGKYVFKYHKYEENIITNISNYYSYKYGLSSTYSFDNINNMKLFYICFPVYYNYINKLSWDYYLELIKIKNRNIRNFYFKVCIFCDLSIDELVYIKNINYYKLFISLNI